MAGRSFGPSLADMRAESSGMKRWLQPRQAWQLNVAPAMVSSAAVSFRPHFEQSNSITTCARYGNAGCNDARPGDALEKIIARLSGMINYICCFSWVLMTANCAITSQAPNKRPWLTDGRGCPGYEERYIRYRIEGVVPVGSMIIVDDEPMVCHSISHIVRELGMGWEVAATAGDGLEALEIMDAMPVDLVLTDIRMPEMDGLAFLEEVHLRYPHVLALVLSAYAEFDYARKALQLGVLDYLLKPVDPGDIRDALLRVHRILQAESDGSPIQNQCRDQAVLRQRIVVEALEGRAEPMRWRQQAEALGLPSSCGQVLTVFCKIGPTSQSLNSWFEDIPPLLADDMAAVHVLWGQNQYSLVLLGGQTAISQPESWNNTVRAIVEHSQRQLPGETKLGIGGRCQVINLSQSYLESLAPGGSQEWESAVSPAAKEAVSTACRWIEQHFREKLTLAEIAAQVHLHPRYFCTVFSKARGQAFSEYLMEIRIEHAKGLLARTDAPCQAVAEEVGYENAGWFSQAFKRLTGVSPSEYRRALGR